MWARIKAFFKRLFVWTETEAEIVKSDALELKDELGRTRVKFG